MINLVTLQQADLPPWALKPLLTLPRAHPPSSEREQAGVTADLQRDLITLARRRKHTPPLSSCIRCIRLLEGALLWPGWACKVQLWLPCPGLRSQECDLEPTLERCWNGRVEQCMQIVLDGVHGPRGLFDWHFSNKAITDSSCVFAHFPNCSAYGHLHTTMWITAALLETSL